MRLLGNGHTATGSASRDLHATIGGVSAPTPEESRAVPIVWVGADELPVIAVNQFVVQVDKGEIFLLAGTLTPPIILGKSPDDMRRQVESLDFVTVRPAARFAIARHRLTELINVLQLAAEMYDRREQEDPR